uniref:DUF1963 domain-containing protein n=1 Tax=Heterorhabditis bacteriophora TaxID=37862 RepID=A0A1I7WMK7_HETBA
MKEKKDRNQWSIKRPTSTQPSVTPHVTPKKETEKKKVYRTVHYTADYAPIGEIASGEYHVGNESTEGEPDSVGDEIGEDISFEDITLEVDLSMWKREGLQSPADLKCKTPEGKLTFFIPKDAQVREGYGAQKPLKGSCPPCESGSQYIYEPISEELSSVPNITPPIGAFYCENNSLLCIEDFFGRLWKTKSKNLTIFPTPKCIDGQCSTFLLFSPNDPDAEMVPDDDSLPLKTASFAENGIFLDSPLQPPISIRGFTCAGCKKSIIYCQSDIDYSQYEDDYFIKES